MKKVFRTTIALLLFLFLSVGIVNSAITTYNCTSLTGGAARSLDVLSVATLVTGDRALCSVGGVFYYFTYDSTLTGAEDVVNHPYIIRPNNYSSAGNWVETLVEGEGVNANLYPTLALANTAAYNAGKALIISKNHTLVANTTLTAVVKVVKGGGFTKASTYTFTLNGAFEAGMYKVFTGFSAGDVKFVYTKQNYPEWWGAAGDNSTDDTLPIQSAISAFTAANGGGTVLFRSKFYVVTSLLTITESFVNLKGESISWIGQAGTYIRSTTANGTILYINGSSLATAIMMNQISDLAIGTDLTTNTTGAGIDIRYTNKCRLTNVNIINASVGINMKGNINTIIDKCVVGRQAVPGGGSTSYGILLDASDINWSNTIKNTLIYMPVSDGVATNFGIYSNGVQISDLFIDSVEIAYTDYGIFLANAAGTARNDVQITRVVIDSYGFEAIHIEAFAETATLSIIGGWVGSPQAALAGTAYGINIYQSNGVTVQGVQIYAATTRASIGIALNQSNYCTISGNILRNWITGIYLSAASLNTVANNNISNLSAYSGTTGISLINTSNRISLMGNVISGYFTNGITTEIGSSANIILGNQVVPTNINNPLVDNGTNDTAHNKVN